MRTFDLPVTAEEVAFLANNLPAGARWPEPWDGFTLAQMPDREPAGGVDFRLKVIAIHRHMKRIWPGESPKAATLPLELTEGELWMLDYMFNNVDYSKTLMGGGTPLFMLVLKVWDILLEAGIGQVDPRYLPASRAGKIELPEASRSFLTEMDALIEGAERTASGEQFE